jgi:O-antigen ligase
MLYAAVLLYVTAVYIRPTEIIPSLGTVPVVDILASLALFLGVIGLLLRPRRFVLTPTDICVVGFWASIVLSNLAWGWFGGAWTGFLEFLPVVFCYFLVRIALESLKQFRGLVQLFVVLNLFLAVNGIVQYHTGIGIGGVSAITAEKRIRGTGIFNDPNDLGMTLVMATAFLLVDVFSPATTVGRRLISVAALIPLAIAIYYTNSRGAILGLGAVLIAFSYRQFRMLSGTLVATTAVLVLAILGPSRTSAIDASESSAQSRVEAWGEGLQMLKARPLFGVGYSRFTEFHSKVAHNSFVHAAAELGLVGATFLVGCFYTFFRNLTTLRRAELSEADDSRWARALSASALGAIVCSLFLSRQYVIVPYLLLAMGASWASIAVGDRRPFWADAFWHATVVVVLTPSAVLLVWVSVRLLGAW